MHLRFDAASLAPRLVLAAILVGCSLPEGPNRGSGVYAPDVAGVVELKTPVSGGISYRLSSGASYLAPTESDYLGGAQPGVGALLLAGTAPRPWVYWLDSQPEEPGVVPPDCYRITGDVSADATHVYAKVHDAKLGDVALALPKAAGWKDDGYVRGDVLAGNHTCVDELGRAFVHF